MIHPIELAALAHLKFCQIHPFHDSLISRLLPNIILHKYKYLLFVFTYVRRDDYYNALKRAITTNQDHIFVRWFVKKYKKDFYKRVAKF